MALEEIAVGFPAARTWARIHAGNRRTTAHPARGAIVGSGHGSCVGAEKALPIRPDGSTGIRDRADVRKIFAARGRSSETPACARGGLAPPGPAPSGPPAMGHGRGSLAT